MWHGSKQVGLQAHPSHPDLSLPLSLPSHVFLFQWKKRPADAMNNGWWSVNRIRGNWTGWWRNFDDFGTLALFEAFCRHTPAGRQGRQQQHSTHWESLTLNLLFFFLVKMLSSSLLHLIIIPPPSPHIIYTDGFWWPSSSFSSHALCAQTVCCSFT